MPPYLYNQLKREHLLRTGSVVLHEVEPLAVSWTRI